ncbi:MAG: thiamine phosphate synthase [Proteobacteria bacterium]|nr:thiamine phosphate synthase [Pseudomonadota bacterium]
MVKPTSLYLISPPSFELDQFSTQLGETLSTNKIPLFQLRVKDMAKSEIAHIAKSLIKICNQYNTKFILNDDVALALEVGAHGVHLGSEDGTIKGARSQAPKGFIIGASCYDSKDLAIKAKAEGADHVSFGTFFPSKTKNSIGKPSTEILTWCQDELQIPCCAIGGITDQNYGDLVNSGANYLAVISYIWQHPQGVKQAINSFKL